MAQAFPGSFRLFRATGIDVFMHWSWFVVAIVAVNFRKGIYQNSVFNAAEYLALFAIVLMHEFGHALACRQVGGHADYILLWPLGGAAFVSPPPRPGSWLWSIAAGPLVNVALIPATLGLVFLAASSGWQETQPDFFNLFEAIASINIVLLVFNMLPVYPLDGGQILFALLWFVIGRVASLMVVSVIGMLGAIALGILAVGMQAPNLWLGLLAVFIGLRAVSGFQQALALNSLYSHPRHEEAACPNCGSSPLAGNFWACNQCGAQFDTFNYKGICPGCGQHFAVTACPECHQRSSIDMWYGNSPTPSVEETEERY